MRVRERSIGVHYCSIVGEEVDVPYVGASANGVRRGSLQVLAKEGAQHGAGALRALAGQDDVSLCPAEDAFAVGRDVQCNRRGWSVDRWRHRQLLLGCQLFVARYPAFQLQRIESQTEGNQ